MRANPTNEAIAAAYEATRRRCHDPKVHPTWEQLTNAQKELLIRFFYEALRVADDD
jgi:hypothetical protein